MVHGLAQRGHVRTQVFRSASERRVATGCTFGVIRLGDQGVVLGEGILCGSSGECGLVAGGQELLLLLLDSALRIHLGLRVRSSVGRALLLFIASLAHRIAVVVDRGLVLVHHHAKLRGGIADLDLSVGQIVRLNARSLEGRSHLGVAGALLRQCGIRALGRLRQLDEAVLLRFSHIVEGIEALAIVLVGLRRALDPFLGGLDGIAELLKSPNKARVARESTLGLLE
ncbi:hypothetical protein D3C87_1292780 [compost metagenome]